MAVHPITNNPRSIGGPFGPQEPPILARIEKLESGMAALEKLGSATQVRVERIDDALARLEPAVREIAVENRKQFADLLNRINGVEVRLASIDGRFAAVDGQLDGIKGRLALIPSIWQTLAILSTLLIGLSQLILTTAKFLHP